MIAVIFSLVSAAASLIGLVLAVRLHRATAEYNRATRRVADRLAAYEDAYGDLPGDA